MLLYRYERKGLVVLLFLIGNLIVLPRCFLKSEFAVFLICDTTEMIPDTFRLTMQQEPLELNTADSISLVRIKGIGPYYAHKILRYRERLGGYYRVEQLKEVKMTYFNVDSLGYLFCADPAYIVKKDLDSLSFKEILRHPYLEYEDVRLIFQAKNKYKHISWNILQEKKVLPVYKLKKIKPYFR